MPTFKPEKPNLPGTTFFEKSVRYSSLLLHFILWLLVGASVLYPRIMHLGGYPATDEGVYAYYSQIIYNSLSSGNGLPNYGTLALYPALLSWVFQFDFNYLFSLRIIDMLMATISGYLLFYISYKESKNIYVAALLATVYLFAANQPIFVQHGFKNSFSAAIIPALVAIIVGQNSQWQHPIKWYFCGALLSVSILLRETFVPFAMLGFISIFFSYGLKNALRYSFGGIIAGTAILFSIVKLRGPGGFESLIHSYQDAYILYESLSSKRIDLFLQNGATSIKEAAWAVITSILLIITFPFLFLKQVPSSFSRILFWFAAATIPLLEPLIKIGFPYHFSLSLIGLCGLSSVISRELLATFKSIFFAIFLAIFLVGAYL